MKRIILFISLLGYLNCSLPSNDDENIIQENDVRMLTTGSGSFIFYPPGELSSQPITVYYHIPEGDQKSMPILFSFHGANRNAEDYRNYWVDASSQSNFIVLSPEFSSNFYPGLGDNYLLGNVFVDGDNPTATSRNERASWTFSVIEPLFDFVKLELSNDQDDYFAWGHSGGAQFLHRFLFFIPENRVSLAICANAGWYTVPEENISFPYGLGQSSLTEMNINSAFAKNLIVHLAEDDNDPLASNLRHNQIVDDQQGLHRFARGNYFFDTSKTRALNLNSPFNWQKVYVPNTGHDAQAMANAAVLYLP